MTLIASSAAYNGCIQLADRMVSIRLREFDPQANKSLLFPLDNAAVAIAYTGRAYIGRTPTDEWLAEKIIGQPLVRGPNGPVAAISVGSMPSLQVDFSQALLHLKNSIDKVFQSDLVSPGKPHERRLELAIVGWMWKRRRRNHARPILCHLIRESMQPTDVQWLPRHDWVPQTPRAIVRFGSWAPSQLHVMNEEALRAAASGGTNVQLVERRLAELMRKRAAESPGYISSDLMVTRIDHPRRGVISVEYLSSPSEHATEFAAIGFSPWIITKNRVQAPCAQIGVFSIGAADWEVKTGRPGRFRGLVGGLLSHERRKWP